MGWLASPERFLKPARIRVAFLILGGAAFLATEFGRFVYRPFVRRHGIQDFGLADSVGNWGGIIVQIFVTLAAMNPTRPQSYRLALFLAIGYVAYEFLQPVLPRGTFDWKDVWGTGVGLCAACAVLWGVWRLFPEEEEPSGREEKGA